MAVQASGGTTALPLSSFVQAAPGDEVRRRAIACSRRWQKDVAKPAFQISFEYSIIGCRLGFSVS